MNKTLYPHTKALEPIQEAKGDSPSEKVELTTHMDSVDNKASRLEEFGTEFLKKESSC